MSCRTSSTSSSPKTRPHYYYPSNKAGDRGGTVAARSGRNTVVKAFRTGRMAAVFTAPKDTVLTYTGTAVHVNRYRRHYRRPQQFLCIQIWRQGTPQQTGPTKTSYMLKQTTFDGQGVGEQRCRLNKFWFQLVKFQWPQIQINNRLKKSST